MLSRSSQPVSLWGLVSEVVAGALLSRCGVIITGQISYMHLKSGMEKLNELISTASAESWFVVHIIIIYLVHVGIVNYIVGMQIQLTMY